ncbi:hypothetical protein ACIRLA_17640 [Streptomyces sp. NPDC102364]|uniref:hypothetical protein n=1 Tax=Streptomyces sp. NPDC102364 TaxID=3366161 RepID=UPI00380A4465
MTTEVKRHCPTCKSEEQHRHVTPKESHWLRTEHDVTFTNDWWRCKREGCRTIRYYHAESQNHQLPEGFDDD